MQGQGMFRDVFCIPGQLSGGWMRQVKPENQGEPDNEENMSQCFLSLYSRLFISSNFTETRIHNVNFQQLL